MKRIALAAAALAVGIGAASGQADLVKERAMLMFRQGEAVGSLTRMARGQAPYDQGKVDEAIVVLIGTSGKLPGLFPVTAKGQSPDSDYYATAKVWENKADFDARLAKLSADIAANGPKAKSPDGLKEALGAITQNCSGCHETYRAKKG
jgi:cytochrome c556